ncbi:hypothetical protein NDN08_007146 [Rhodosorus marinus]|uniref:Uncharacterized protein n=1 Tax=Rhodosorus marinus TaxID=101924 RepID=A0AAV8UJR7_9RHOD|nr:hypothetical protein NDN08_007146 [Rhodosorus marinus]
MAMMYWGAEGGMEFGCGSMGGMYGKADMGIVDGVSGQDLFAQGEGALSETMLGQQQRQRRQPTQMQQLMEPRLMDAEKFLENIRYEEETDMSGVIEYTPQTVARDLPAGYSSALESTPEATLNDSVYTRQENLSAAPSLENFPSMLRQDGYIPPLPLDQPAFHRQETSWLPSLQRQESTPSASIQELRQEFSELKKRSCTRAGKQRVRTTPEIKKDIRRVEGMRQTIRMIRHQAMLSDQMLANSKMSTRDHRVENIFG